MEVLLVVAVPLALLGLMLAMERVERPFRDRAAGQDVEAFLGKAQPDEVEVFVRDGFAAALDRHWSRRGRIDRLRPSRPGMSRRLGDPRRRLRAGTPET